MMRRLALALLALGGLSACPGTVGAICELDDECAEGLTCFAGTCQELGTPDGTVTFEVVPQPASGFGSATFPMGEQPLRLGFCGPSVVTGSVAGGAEVVVAGTPAGLPGVSRRWQERVGPAFSLQVPPGAWTLTFLLPAGAGGELPPPERRDAVLGRCETVSLGTVQPTGAPRRARFAVVVDPLRDPRPRCGVIAQIFDAANGSALSQAVSFERDPGVGCTAPAGGAIELPFRAPAAGDRLELRLAPLAGAPTFAARAVPFTLPAGGSIDLGSVGVGDEGAVERVAVAVIDPDGAAVPGARVRAGRVSGGDERPFAPPLAEELAGEPGTYELWLLPGTYAIEATPPPGVHAGASRCVEPAAGGACAEALVVQAGETGSYRAPLPLPLSLAGRVLDDARAPVVRARVQALPLAAGGRPAEAVSDAAGRYELFLDPGSYEIVVQPREPGAAWRRLALDEPLLESASRDLVLPRAARVVGSVTANASGRQVPLPQALVRAWRVDGAQGPRVVGETLTDASGSFRLALPAGP